MSDGPRAGAGRGPTAAGLALVAAIAVVMLVDIVLTLLDGGFGHAVRP